MSTVREHYERLLAEHYSWMLGDFEARRAEERSRLEKLGVVAGSSAWDLGAGSGLHSLALADLGCAVTAVELSPKLVSELRRRASGKKISVIEGDLLEFLERTPGPVETITCMGDTLTHLESLDAVAAMIERAASRLSPGGRLVLTFRDLTVERTGLDRFLPVRSDAGKIFTCFLEYFPHHVQVHDLVHSFDGTAWTLAASTYRKLRLGEEQIEALLRVAGLEPAHTATSPGGLVEISALRR